MNSWTCLIISSFFTATWAQSITAPTPGQPQQTGTIGGFEIVGDSLVSAQQMFLGTLNTVYIVDKVENNPAQVNGHPAWASEYTVSTNKGRTMDARTNAFCAGGNVMGNGTWINIGGNQGVTYGGDPAASQYGGGPYDDPDGRQTIRLLNPCDDGSCDWFTAPDITSKRWYPTVETLEDGSVIILGGCDNGGYVNSADQDNPTFEFFPSRGDPVRSNILATTLPTNLYPLTWLLPSGKIFIQSNWDTALLDSTTYDEKKLDPMLDAVRTYPASAGTVMLPLTAANNWTATILFCGGTNLKPDQWTPQFWTIIKYPASTSCVTITPDKSKSYVRDDPLPERRTMPNFIYLPTGKILLLNGARNGTAGYGNETWAAGMSYSDDPIFTPILYDPDAPAGQKWTTEGFSPSTIPRMYHSTALLLPDGAVLVSGSNPNSDYNTGPKVPYPTEYRVEKFYPSYYNTRRPQPKGLLAQLGYGGDYFNVELDSDDLFGDVSNLEKTKVILMRTGFSTHAMNMGQRFLQLSHSHSGYENNTATLHVHQVPTNPAIFAPGPAMLFVVVNDVPSVAVQVMVGSGKIEKQTMQSVPDLPESFINRPTQSQPDNAAAGSHAGANLSSMWMMMMLLAGVVCAWT